MKTTLLVIFPGREVHEDCCFSLLVAETGECLASHLCSHSAFALGDLYDHRPERIEEFTNRFGPIEVKYIDQTNISKEELLKRNQEWYDSLPKEEQQSA